MKFPSVALSAALALTSFSAMAADYPAPKEGSWIAKDFKFHSGETSPFWCCMAPADRAPAC
jgi:homoserine O-acetyltransferase/O-succinyltransferase